MSSREFPAVALLALLTVACGGPAGTVPAGTAPSVAPSQTTPAPSVTTTVSPTASEPREAGHWLQVASMGLGRSSHTATVLLDGDVLVAGGFTDVPCGPTADSALYDPASNSWSSLPALKQARALHTATTLPDGQVLVVGGSTCAGPTGSSELFDPKAKSWSPASSINPGRSGHSAAMLPNGKVLVVGGTEYVTPALLYDPATDTWTGLPTMARPLLPAVVVLTDGKVFIANGIVNQPPSISGQVNLYDSATNVWLDGAPVPSGGRLNAVAVRLADGRVMIAGGRHSQSQPGDPCLNSVLLYDGTINRWADGPPMATPRCGAGAAPLADGRVLVAGGVCQPECGGITGLASAEIYDPRTNRWAATGSLNTARGDFTLSVLPDGRLIAIGGLGAEGRPLASAETYPPV